MDIDSREFSPAVAITVNPRIQGLPDDLVGTTLMGDAQSQDWAFGNPPALSLFAGNLPGMEERARLSPGGRMGKIAHIAVQPYQAGKSRAIVIVEDRCESNDIRRVREVALTLGMVISMDPFSPESGR